MCVGGITAYSSNSKFFLGLSSGYFDGLDDYVISVYIDGNLYIYYVKEKLLSIHVSGSLVSGA